MKIGEILLRLLLTKGELVTKESYYGDCVDYEGTKATQKAIDNVIKKIDMAKTKMPVEKSQERFQGTFCEEQDCTRILETTIVFKGGKKEHWKMEIESTNFCDVIELALDISGGKL